MQELFAWKCPQILYATGNAVYETFLLFKVVKTLVLLSFLSQYQENRKDYSEGNSVTGFTSYIITAVHYSFCVE